MEPDMRNIVASLLPDQFQHNSLRVAAGSDMTRNIAFALTSLQREDSTPLLLHSFITSLYEYGAAERIPEPKQRHREPEQKIICGIPKLISIVEIVKRSFLEALLLPKTDAKGKGRADEETLGLPVVDPLASELVDSGAAGEVGEAGVMSKTKRKRSARTKLKLGLHQYTLVGTLESLGIEPAPEREEDKEREVVENWLESGKKGAKSPKKKHTPYMMIILSKVSIPELNKRKEFTYQPPLQRPSLSRGNPDTTTKDSKRPAPVEEMDLDPPTSTTAEKDTEGTLKKKRRRRSNKKNKEEEKMDEGKGGKAGDGEVSIGREMDLNP